MQARPDDAALNAGREYLNLSQDVTKPDLLVIYKEAESRKQAFIATVDSYNADARRHGNVELDIRAEHTWSDVLSAQQRVFQERHVATPKGFKGFLWTKLRHIGDNSESFQSWLKLLPKESHYISVLCGGLTLLLEAAHRMSELRESIRSILDEIPSILANAKQYLDVFVESPRLHKCNADLYVAILDTLNAIVRQYQKHVTRRISSAVFKQSMSGTELQEKMRTIDTYVDRLGSQASIDAMQRQKDMAKTIVSLAMRQDCGFNTVAIQQEGIVEVLRAQEVSRVRDRQLLESVEQSLNNVLAQFKANPRRAADCIRCLEQGFSTDALGNPQDRSHPTNSTADWEDDLRRLEALLERLDVDHEDDVAGRDTSLHLKLIHTLSFASQDRAVALMNSPHLRAWLTSTTSCAMLINGQMFSDQHESRQSPLSYICAKFTDSVLGRSTHTHDSSGNSLFVVRWFCGQHTDARIDYDAHPPGMLSNMLSQLVHQLLTCPIRPKPGWLSLPDSESQLSDLCALFAQLTTSLPAGTALFCIIDGITYYEDAACREECDKVLSMLLGLTRRNCEAADGPLVKLLATAPLRSHQLQRLFEAEEIITMAEQYPSNGGFSALQWDDGIGRAIGE